jgi:hypothetical protein
VDLVGRPSPTPVVEQDEALPVALVGEDGPESCRFAGKNWDATSSPIISLPGVLIVVKQFAAAVILVYFFSLCSRVILFQTQKKSN